MNRKLKAKIIEKFGTQWRFAQKIGEDDTTISRVVTGARPLAEDKKQRWAKELGTTTDIFDHEKVA